jgi:chloramphenicol O-acetyltransferase type A
VQVIDINTWNRKPHFEHFIALKDPYFAVTIPFDVTKAYHISKTSKISFFGKYLHDCMKAINAIDEFKLRIVDNKVIKYDTINASSTLMRANNIFSFTYIEFDEDLNQFLKHINAEKNRIETSNDLYPLRNDQACIHCSVLPWLNFSGHKEPVSGVLESVPKLAFGQATKINNRLVMNVAIAVNHALADGYHVGLFSEKFQEYLNH